MVALGVNEHESFAVRLRLGLENRRRRDDSRAERTQTLQTAPAILRAADRRAIWPRLSPSARSFAKKVSTPLSPDISTHLRFETP